MKRWFTWIVGTALTVSLFGAPIVRADDDYWQSARTFNVMPEMTIIPGTSVYYSPNQQSYDVYRYGDSWYVVQDGSWYRSYTWRGPYSSVSMTMVPRDIVTVPVTYRRYWTTSGGYSNEDQGYRARVSTITFNKRPKMREIPDTRVFYDARRHNVYDLYRYGNSYYLVDSGSWYRASSWRGPFLFVNWREVPGEVLTVPPAYRRTWAAPAGYYGRDRDRDRDFDRDRYRDSDRLWNSGRTFMVEPRMKRISGTSVYYSRDTSGFDLYRYQGDYYVVDNGVWFRAGSWRGPFVAINESSIPNEITTIPSRYRHEWSDWNGY